MATLSGKQAAGGLRGCFLLCSFLVALATGNGVLAFAQASAGSLSAFRRILLQTNATTNATANATAPTLSPSPSPPSPSPSPSPSDAGGSNSGSGIGNQQLISNQVVGLSPGAVAGIVIACIVAGCLVIAGTVFYCIKFKRQGKMAPPLTATNPAYALPDLAVLHNLAGKTPPTTSSTQPSDTASSDITPSHQHNYKPYG